MIGVMELSITHVILNEWGYANIVIVIVIAIDDYL